MKACATASSIWTPADVEAIDAAALGQDLAVAMIPRREIASAIVRVASGVRNHISFATGAPPCAEVRSRRRNVAQSRAAIGPADKKPPQAGEGPSDHKGADAGSVCGSSRRTSVPRSVRLPIAEKLKEPQRTPKNAKGRSAPAIRRLR